MDASSTEWAPARIVETWNASSDVRGVALQLDVSGDDAPKPSPGSHMDFEVVLPDGRTASRQYSIVESRGPGLFVVAVKRAPQSRGGSAYMWTLSPGDTVRVGGIRNDFPLDYVGRSYRLIAGGIGVTPLISMARALQALGRPVRLDLLVRDAEDAPFAAEMEAELGAGFALHGDVQSGQRDIDALVREIDKDALAYVCGPLPMMAAVRTAWAAQGRDPTALCFETFGQSDDGNNRPFEVEVEETGAIVEVGANTSMLEALVAAEQPILSGCLKGECGLCKVNVLETTDAVDHRDVLLSERERAEGNTMCTCVSRVVGGRLRISLNGVRHGRGA